MAINDNLIFLNESDLDKPIYRVFSFDRFEQLLVENKNVLVKPKRWDDPFENFILNSTGRLNDGREFQIGFRDNFYGQCWSLLSESDAMWRIYSPQKDGIKVKTTIRKLFLPLYYLEGEYIQKFGTESNLSSFVGKVKYSRPKELVKMLSDKKRMSNKIFDQTGWGQASTFFFKRLAFKHEKEIRLIHNIGTKSNNDIFKYDIIPNELFEEIVFDPRMSEEVYKEKIVRVRSLGYEKRIRQSSLYKLKNFTIELETP